MSATTDRSKVEEGAFSRVAQEKGQARATAAKFIQISSGQPFGQGLTLFALDDAGDVWQIIPGREDHWTPLSRQRGLPESR